MEAVLNGIHNHRAYNDDYEWSYTRYHSLDPLVPLTILLFLHCSFLLLFSHTVLHSLSSFFIFVMTLTHLNGITAFSKDISYQTHSREEAETEPTPPSMGPSQGRQYGQVQFQETSLAQNQAWIVIQLQSKNQSLAIQ